LALDLDLNRKQDERPANLPPPPALTEPVWRAPAGDESTQTLQQLIDSLLQLQSKHNASDALMIDVFDLLRDVLPKDAPDAQPRLPPYGQVRDLLAESSSAAMQQS